MGQSTSDNSIMLTAIGAGGPPSEAFVEALDAYFYTTGAP